MHPLLFTEHEMRLCFADPLALGVRHVAESWAKGQAWKGQWFLVHPGLQTGSSPHALLCSPAGSPADSAPAANTIGRQQILGPWVAVWSRVCCHHGQLPWAAETHREHTRLLVSWKCLWYKARGWTVRENSMHPRANLKVQ